MCILKFIIKMLLYRLLQKQQIDSFQQMHTEQIISANTVLWNKWIDQGLVSPDALQGDQAHLGTLHGRQCQQQGTAQQHCGQHGLAQQEDPPFSPSSSLEQPLGALPQWEAPPESKSLCPTWGLTSACWIDLLYESKYVGIWGGEYGYKPNIDILAYLSFLLYNLVFLFWGGQVIAENQEIHYYLN